MFTRILVPIDFSEPSGAALEYARSVAAKFHGTLRLLHVVEDPIMPEALGSVPETFIGGSFTTRDDLLRQTRERLALLICDRDRATFGATTDAIFGHTERTIVRYATDSGCDLIVMGTHGRTGLAHVLMGSVAEHVVRTAPCPVLTVRAVPDRQRAAAGELCSAITAA